MIVLRDKNGHLWTLITRIDLIYHIITVGQLLFEFIVQDVNYDSIPLKFALQSHKKNTGFLIHVLIKIDNIASLGVNKTGYRTDYSRLVRTIY